MSDMVDVINRLESWVRNYGHEKQPAFIADLRALIGTAKASQRAVAMLQKAQRYDAFCDNTGETMEPCSRGDWVLYDNISQAIKILQEGRQ